jgi:CRP-like cAMP-binding protein
MAPEPHNQILAALSPSDLKLLNPHLKNLVLRQGDVLLEQDSHMKHFYFPTEGMVSLVAMNQDGGSVEIAAIGREGIVGAALADGTGTAPMTAIVQVAGHGAQIGAEQFHAAVRASGTLRAVLGHHNEALLAQIVRSVACNSQHTVEARMCRWLLIVHDRVDGDVLHLTQEFLGQMLGTQRTTVNVTARTLQKAGLIKYSRGRITVVDRAGLEESACECYAIGRKHFDRLMSLSPALD